MIQEPQTRKEQKRKLYGVKFVKGNFLAGRSFQDDEDLSMQLTQWLSERNNGKCQAHGYTPNELLPKEREALEPLTETSESYGLLHLLRVNPESVIRFETNCYSVPEYLIGQIVTVRVASNELRVYYDRHLVAQHERNYQKRQRIRNLDHYERTLSRKPRAKVMAYSVSSRSFWNWRRPQRHMWRRSAEETGIP